MSSKADATGMVFWCASSPASCLCACLHAHVAASPPQGCRRGAGPAGLHAARRLCRMQGGGAGLWVWSVGPLWRCVMYAHSMCTVAPPGVAGVAACQYAREVLFTDAVDAVAALALNNALANGAVRRGDVDAASCVASSCVLRWGVDDAEVAAAHGTFDIVLASEVLYVHWVRGCFLFCFCLEYRVAVLWPCLW